MVRGSIRAVELRIVVSHQLVVSLIEVRRDAAERRLIGSTQVQFYKNCLEYADEMLDPVLKVQEPVAVIPVQSCSLNMFISAIYCSVCAGPFAQIGPTEW